MTLKNRSKNLKKKTNAYWKKTSSLTKKYIIEVLKDAIEGAEAISAKEQTTIQNAAKAAELAYKRMNNQP